jgi:MFS family permease
VTARVDPTGAATAPGPTPARATATVVTHYFLTNLGYFGLLSTLVVALSAAGFDAGRVAVLVMVFTLTSKLAKIPLAPWLDRVPAAGSVLLGCALAAIGFAGLRFADDLAPSIACLVVAGTGVSVNALASKQLAAAASDRSGAPARVFATINVGINVAAAVAAPLALMLAERDRHDVVLFGVAAAYTVAGSVTYLTCSRMHREPPAGTGPSWRSYWDVLRLPGLGPFLVVNLFGWFLYGQLFNVLALHVSDTLDSPGRLGWLYTLNALLVVFVQLGVTRLAERLVRGGAASTVVLAYATFALAFALAYLIPGYAGAVVFVVVFTLAEMMFVPSVDVVLLDIIGPHNRAVGYSILSISTAIGEASGGGAGVAGYRWLADHGYGSQFWLIATGVACAFTLVSLALRRAVTRAATPTRPVG